jgi:NAD(P)-dependent dehydrogenase (short-subunit alcohol dehydrogenase family)
MKKLAGKVALVTGSAEGGIGAATAELFAAEGAKVACVDILHEGNQQTVDAIRAAGGEAINLVADVSVGADVQRVVDETVKAFGPPTVLANIAGIDVEKHRPTHEIEESDFDAVIATNLKGTWLMCKYVIPHMIEAGGGVIVNCSSVASEIPYVSAGYSASKAGVVGLQRETAREVAKHNIRVNAFGPGGTTSKISREQQKQMAARGIVLAPEQIEASLKKLNVQHRMADPKEQALVALFLACDDSSFVTGQNLVVDGGLMVNF